LIHLEALAQSDFSYATLDPIDPIDQIDPIDPINPINPIQL